jgi:hypothetical protein
MFWLFRQKIDKSNRAPIYIRLTIDGMEKDMSSGRKVEPKHWDLIALYGLLITIKEKGYEGLEDGKPV